MLLRCGYITGYVQVSHSRTPWFWRAVQSVKCAFSKRYRELTIEMLERAKAASERNDEI